MRPSIAIALVALFAFAAPVAAQDRDGAGEQAMLEAINARRAAAGLPTLERNGQLDAAAAVHSADMASRDVLEHVSQTTGTPADRVHTAGLAIEEIAENVAMHRTVAAAQRSLEQSDAHLANMLNARFTHVGIAAVRDDRGLYVTQVFGRLEAAALPAVEPAPEVAPPPPPAIVVPEPAPQPVPPPPPSPNIVLEPVQPPLAQAAPEQAPAPNGSTTVIVPRPTTGSARGYWICANGRWWYYHVPPSAQPGQQLQPDLSVTGAPPGYAPGQCVAGATVVAPPPQIVQPVIVPPPPPPQIVRPVIVPPPQIVRPVIVPPPPPPVVVQPRVVQPRGRRYIIVQPRPGTVIAPYVPGPGGVVIDFSVGPRPRARVRRR